MTEQDTYIIERYLTGRLPREEAEALEARFREDPALKAEAQQLRAIMAAVRQQVLDEKKALLREESLKTKDHRPGLLVIQPVWRYVAVAAALVLAVFLIRPLLDSGPEIRNAYLAEHFNDFIIHDTHKGTGSAADDLELQKGYNLFAAKKFDEAVLILERNWEVHRDTVSLFYLWASFMAKSSPSEAASYEPQLSESFRQKFELHDLIKNTHTSHVQ